MKIIWLAGGESVLVDDKDYNHLNKYKWHRKPGPYSNYAMRAKKMGKKSTLILMHRIITPPPLKRLYIDHINGNTLDNQRENLRFCTNQQNQMNRHADPGGSSKYRGVNWCKTKKRWRARLKINGKHINIGRFRCEHKAAQAVNSTGYKLFGRFFKFNIITGD